nr:hypothetical protein [Tanacetum cinerariifolium]
SSIGDEPLMQKIHSEIHDVDAKNSGSRPSTETCYLEVYLIGCSKEIRCKIPFQHLEVLKIPISALGQMSVPTNSCTHLQILPLRVYHHFSNRIYNSNKQNPVDPTLSPSYATQLQQEFPKNVEPRIAINMDPNTPRTFDNRSKQTAITWANYPTSFNSAFITKMTKLGRVGVKTGSPSYQNAKFVDGIVILCDQREKEYRVGCLTEWKT